MIGEIMKQNSFDQMPLDDLWALHEELIKKLAPRMAAERALLTERLEQLASGTPTVTRLQAAGRRPYPEVFPKFQNPNDPSETWAGRGKKPRWMVEQLKLGGRIDDFKIRQAAE